MEKIQIRIALGVLSLILLACQTGGGPSSSDSRSFIGEISPEAVQKRADQVSILSINVENLFDTEHDTDREDYTYLPLSEKKKPEIQKFCEQVSNSFYKDECFHLDWNENVLKRKLQNIGQVIRFVDGGKGPDNMILIEVENERVLKRLVAQELSSLGYQTVVLLEGPDTRGIDPGFVSKFPLVGHPQLHLIPFHDLSEKEMASAKKTRGILEVTVMTPQKQEITFFAGHFPSQASPTILRRQALKKARDLLQEASRKGRIAVLAGDLNITTEEEEQEKLFENILKPTADVSRYRECTGCLGSHFYKGHWSFLDAIAVDRSIEKLNWEIVPQSLQVVRTKIQMKRNGSPLRFDPETLEGVSDHFPLYERLQPKSAKALH